MKSRRHTAKVEIIRNMACTTVRLLVLSPAAKARNEAGGAGAAGMIEPSTMLGAFKFLEKRARDWRKEGKQDCS